MSAQLVANAARNGRAWYGETIWDRIFAAWFRRFVYTQIWEDPEADLAALQLPLGSTIVTMSSGGCNALSYLAAQPAQVYAVDLDDAHLALLKLKLAGSSSARGRRPPMRGSIASDCGRCSIMRHAPIGTDAISWGVRGMPILRTASIVTACLAGSSGFRISWPGSRGSILQPC
jgi:Protein of unknown function (DUF3419)